MCKAREKPILWLALCSLFKANLRAVRVGSSSSFPFLFFFVLAFWLQVTERLIPISPLH